MGRRSYFSSSLPKIILSSLIAILFWQCIELLQCVWWERGQFPLATLLFHNIFALLSDKTACFPSLHNLYWSVLQQPRPQGFSRGTPVTRGFFSRVRWDISVPAGRPAHLRMKAKATGGERLDLIWTAHEKSLVPSVLSLRFSFHLLPSNCWT